nr:MAG TPA_asm: hypothetical protein [Caudoviricetes sp.]
MLFCVTFSTFSFVISILFLNFGANLKNKIITAKCYLYFLLEIREI